VRAPRLRPTECVGGPRPSPAPSHGILPKAVRMRRSDARARSELKVETHPTLLDTLLSAFTFRS
jgi:hypothetical protein